MLFNSLNNRSRVIDNYKIISYILKVQGIGPIFKMTIKVQNISTSSPSMGLFITFIYDEKLYKIPMSYIDVSIIQF